MCVTVCVHVCARVCMWAYVSLPLCWRQMCAWQQKEIGSMCCSSVKQMAFQSDPICPSIANHWRPHCSSQVMAAHSAPSRVKHLFEVPANAGRGSPVLYCMKAGIMLALIPLCIYIDLFMYSASFVIQSFACLLICLFRCNYSFGAASYKAQSFVILNEGV